MNAILPGPVITGMVPKVVLENPEIMTQQIKEHGPLGRLCMPEDIAPAAIYLTSDESLMLTGQGIVIDGGDTIFN